jgi:putative transposase
MRLKELAAARPRFGYLRLHMLLRREGWRVNRKRVYRLYREEGLQVRTKKRRKKIATRVRAPQSEATSRDERWSMDFVSDQLVGGRRFRVLTLVDLYSRECLAMRAGFSIKGGDVAAVLDGLKRNGRKPKTITVDNGSEFTSKELDTWSYLNDVKLDFIRPGKPVENCYIESFNGKLRDECLNMNLFFTLAQVEQTMRNWLHDYNHVRPHRSLGGVPPSYRGEQITHGVPNPDFSI